ncbi:MAG: acyl carrier protein [Kiritimatiellae bacterium]|nr:acyl carrier protein [Kiritimatiellia bacterium]
MSETTNSEDIESKIKEVIVSSLDLEDVSPAEIETDAPLFGEGLGLDSIDALELGMAIKREFGVSFSKNPAENKRTFRSVRTLAEHIRGQRST